MRKLSKFVLGFLVAAMVLGGVATAQAGLKAVAPTSAQLIGTSTNDSAAAGIVGEYVSSTVASASAVALTTATPANMTSLSLTAGDWDVACTLVHKLAATTTVTILQAGISTTSAALPTVTAGGSDYFVFRQASAAPAGDFVTLVGPHRVSLSGTTTVYCVANDTFATSTNAAYGTLRARRVR